MGRPNYIRVAEKGYPAVVDGSAGAPAAGYFPGLPLLLRVFGAIGVDLVVAGLVISLVAGAVAVVALHRLAEREERSTGSVAVLMLLVAPTAVFLAAGYTEALFLAFALPAWLAAGEDRWWRAGLLGAAATAVRVTGLFLAAGLAVRFLTNRHRRWREAPALVLPVVPFLGFVVFLHERTGDWLAWRRAQVLITDRRFAWPWDALHTTWLGVTGDVVGVGGSWMWAAEIVAVAVGITVTGWLLWRRRWGEGAYMGVQMGCSRPRATTSRSAGPPCCGGHCGSGWPGGAGAARSCSRRTSPSPSRWRWCWPPGSRSACGRAELRRRRRRSPSASRPAPTTPTAVMP